MPALSPGGGAVRGVAAIIASVLTLIGAALTPRHAAAQPVNDLQDGQVWAQLLVLGQLSPNWRTHVEVQPRWFDEASELGLTIIRAAIGRQLTPRAAVYGGYGWVPRTYGAGVRHEQRTWQQLSLTYPELGRWLPSSRVRLEQRWLDPWADASHRLRVLTRAQRPLGGGRRWHLALYDEAMFTLDTTGTGPARGYDRNRLFSGIGRRLSPAVTAEWGYLWENSTVRGPGQRNDHVPIVMLNVTWPQQP